MSRLRYSDLAGKAARLLKLTGLTPEEFEGLSARMSPLWDKFIRRYTLEGKPRQRLVQKERKNSTLPTIEDKLLFLLYELRNYPTQEVLATQFGMEQPHASMWLKLLRPILQEALHGELPERYGEKISKAIGDRELLIIDGAERPVLRSGDKETQAEEYSGKKKTLH